MNSLSRPSHLWITWLAVVSAGVAVFGLLLVMAPGLASEGFSLLIYLDVDRIAAFGADAARYIALAHAVLGSVMFGWGVALVMIVYGQLAGGSLLGWRIIAISVAAWFVPDTAYSIWSGYWQNAALNLGFVVLYLIPLAATRRNCRG